MSVLLSVTDLVLGLARRRWPDARLSSSGNAIASSLLIVHGRMPLIVVNLYGDVVVVWRETGQRGRFDLGDPDFGRLVEEFVLGYCPREVR